MSVSYSLGSWADYKMLSWNEALCLWEYTIPTFSFQLMMIMSWLSMNLFSCVSLTVLQNFKWSPPSENMLIRWDNFVRSESRMDLSECQMFCIKAVGCLSLEFYYSKQRCHCNRSNRISHPELFQAANDSVYFELICELNSWWWLMIFNYPFNSGVKKSGMWQNGNSVRRQWHHWSIVSETKASLDFWFYHFLISNFLCFSLLDLSFYSSIA